MRHMLFVFGTRWAGPAGWGCGSRKLVFAHITITDTCDNLIHRVVDKLLSEISENIGRCILESGFHCRWGRTTTRALRMFSNELAKFIYITLLPDHFPRAQVSDH